MLTSTWWISVLLFASLIIFIGLISSICLFRFHSIGYALKLFFEKVD